MSARPFSGTESYMHRAAKGVVAGWIRSSADARDLEAYLRLDPILARPNRDWPCRGVWIEYPIAHGWLPGEDNLWDERAEFEHLEDRCPSVEEIRGAGYEPACVCDVAVAHKGRIVYAVEVVHRHPTPLWKREILHRLGIELVEVRASWVMNQVRPPAALKVLAA